MDEVQITSFGVATETPDNCSNCNASLDFRKSFHCIADDHDHWVCGDCLSNYGVCKQSVFGVQRHKQKIANSDDWKGFSEQRSEMEGSE